MNRDPSSVWDVLFPESEPTDKNMLGQWKAMLEKYNREKMASQGIENRQLSDGTISTPSQDELLSYVAREATPYAHTGERDYTYKEEPRKMVNARGKEVGAFADFLRKDKGHEKEAVGSTDIVMGTQHKAYPGQWARIMLHELRHPSDFSNYGFLPETQEQGDPTGKKHFSNQRVGEDVPEEGRILLDQMINELLSKTAGKN